MMKAIVAILLLSILSEGQAQSNFRWLIGQWKLEGKNTFEVWKENGNQTLSGRAFHVKGADTLVTEVIALRYYDGAFHYIPDVAGDQPPVDFKITSSDESSFVAENPHHDFPKKITYLYSKLNERENIRATISGDGKSISYLFSRIE